MNSEIEKYIEELTASVEPSEELDRDKRFMRHYLNFLYQSDISVDSLREALPSELVMLMYGLKVYSRHALLGEDKLLEVIGRNKSLFFDTYYFYKGLKLL